MPAKSRIIVVSLIILLGGVLFAYCVLFYPIEIATPAQGGPATASVKDASTTASEPDKSSQSSQNRSGGRSRPRAGAT